MNSNGARAPYPSLPTHSYKKSARRFLSYVHMTYVYYHDYAWGEGVEG